MIEVKAYQCEYCRRRVAINRTYIRKHEYICYHNPRRKACQTCKNRIPSEDDDAMWCAAKTKRITELPKWKTCECKSWRPK